MNNEYRQIFDTISQGLVLVDRDMVVTDWNRWMEMHSNISASEIIGKPLFDFFPVLQQKRSFIRAIKCAFSFGSFGYFSQKLHGYIFPLRNPHTGFELFPQMQQHCSLGPLRDNDGQINRLFITVQDVTEFVLYEHRLTEMTRIDSLTGLYNRRFLAQRLEEEILRCKRHGHSLCLMMIDIDHFKQINDTHGHLCGDTVLRHISRSLRDMFRKSDVVARFGGEEFVCMLPETSLDMAVILAERCRENIANSKPACANKQLTVTISIGVTNISTRETTDSLLKRADDAMYQAKISGRNCCVILPANPSSNTELS